MTALIIKFAVRDYDLGPTGKPFELPMDWPEVYFVDDPKLNFTSANLFCQKNYHNSHLAIVATSDEEEVLMLKIQDLMSSSKKSCKKIFVGYRAVMSRVWQSIDRRSFLPALTLPFQHDFWPDSYDCMTVQLSSDDHRKENCTKSTACAVCETTIGCDEKNKSRENGCYVLDTDATPSRRSLFVSNRRGYIIESKNGTKYLQYRKKRNTTTGEPAVVKKMDFNSWQRACRDRHQGRLGAFLGRNVPDEIRQELEEDAIKQGKLAECGKMAAARAMAFAHEFETIYEKRMTYESNRILDSSNTKQGFENLCLAADPKKDYNWVRTGCDELHCFACTLSEPSSSYDYSYDVNVYPDENTDSDLLFSIFG